MKPYQDKSLLYQLYVVKRMNIKDIAELFKTNYNCKTTPQTVYNWIKNYDLLKYRGKGRNISATKTGSGHGAAAGRAGGVYGGNQNSLKKRRPKGFMGKN